MATPNPGHSIHASAGANGRPVPSPDPAELRARMASVRGELEKDIAGVSHKVHDVTHWQYYVKKFPLACLGAAMLAGYVLVPSKKPGPVQLTDEQIKELADAGKLQIVHQPKSTQNTSVAQQAVLALGTVAARAGMAYIGKLIGEQGQADD